MRAIEHGLRFGEHGLPLIGTGDWNDGMNLVGEHGKGESVWLAFFLYDVLTQFAERGPPARRRCLRRALHGRSASSLRENIEQHAWDGEWYRRAYFDDGTPLGSASQCRMPDRLDRAELVGAVRRRRPRTRHAWPWKRSTSAWSGATTRLIQLLRSAVRQVRPRIPATSGYVPGVRENGGQYTHAAIWADGVRRAGRPGARLGTAAP